MQIASTAFKSSEIIPSKYTCDGDRFLSPPLSVTEVPLEAQSLALVMDDPDVPKALMPEGVFTHWVLFNIPVTTLEIPEGRVLGTPGANTRGEPRYTGPCPPPEYEPSTHRYFFKLYALDKTLVLPEGASRQEVEAAMSTHILAEATIFGVYSRK